MITLDEKIVAVWYLKLDPVTDWMAAISEITENEEYSVTYRFRYYEDTNVFESKDRKSWYSGIVTGSKHFVLESFKSVVRGMQAVSSEPETFYELENTGDFKDFMRKFQDAPFAYVRRISNKEFKKMTGETE